jgi:cytochrome c5
MQRDSMNHVFVAAAVAIAMPAAAGEAEYRRVCFACHDRQAAHPASLGAPRLGDRAAWESRVGRGLQRLYEAALNGRPPEVPPMPRGDLTEAEVKAAVDYMVKSARLRF